MVSATVKAFRDTVGNPGLMKGPAAREALQDFLDLLSTAHPVRECPPPPPPPAASVAAVYA